MSRPTQDQIDAVIADARTTTEKWPRESCFAQEAAIACLDDDLKAAREEVERLRLAVYEGISIAAENDAMAALLGDPDLFACWDSARDGSDPTPPECDGGWDENGNMVSEVCWEHRRRACLAARAKRMSGGT